MNIVAFSMTPLFADRSMGGAQKQLKKVALHLAEQGHHVTILCTQRSDARRPFRWHERVQVVPLYRFKQPFPEPYATPTYNIAAAIQDTGDYLAQADVFYSHDGGLIFPYVYRNIPAVVSLRSIVFSETLQSGYLFQGDALIVPSEHTRDVWLNTAGRFFAGLSARTHVIHNGLDFDVYQPTEPRDLLGQLPVNPAQHRILLYPHRPEAPKGILQTLALVDALVKRYGLDDVRVLVPRWLDTGLSADVRQFYNDLEADIIQRGLQHNFVFHDWISDTLMPQYLSLGNLTVALGNYVETFGNVPYESLACGTPVIAARVGPYRDMLPESVLVDYGDTTAAAEKAAAILQEEAPVPPEITRWLHENFQQSAMVEAYAQVILNASKQPPLDYQHSKLTGRRYRVAPWCYQSAKGVYNDFRGDYSTDEQLLSIIENPLEAEAAVLEYWYREGYLVPLQEQAL